jgi:hypothetical protein
MPQPNAKRDNKLADDARLLRAWKKFHAEEKAAVLAGPYNATLVELFRMFSAIEHVTPAQLVGFVGAIDWGSVDYQTRVVTLHELNAAITRYRERRGLEPISDPLPKRTQQSIPHDQGNSVSPEWGANRGAARLQYRNPSEIGQCHGCTCTLRRGRRL